MNNDCNYYFILLFFRNTNNYDSTSKKKSVDMIKIRNSVVS